MICSVNEEIDYTQCKDCKYDGNEGLKKIGHYRWKGGERGVRRKLLDAQRTINHATTSAALKLLRRLLIGLSPGLPDLGAATTTAAASLLIQLVGGTPMAVREAGVSCTDPVGRCPGRFAATGKREGVGVVS